jgi:hypothetical protein
MKLTREQTQALIDTGVSKGFSGKDILDNLVARGYEPEGIDISKVKSTLVKMGKIKEEPIKKPFMEKVADFTGGKELAQGVAQAINLPQASKQIDDMLNQAITQQDELLSKKKELRASGKDTTAIDKALKINSENLAKIGAEAEGLLNPNDLTAKKVIGDALQLATTIAGAGTLSGATKTVTGARTVGEGIIQGAKTGAITGAGFGGVTGVSQGLQDERSLSELPMQALKGAGVGAVTGGILGGVTGGISGAINQKLNPTIKIKGKNLTLDELHTSEGTKLFESLTPDEQLQFANFDKLQSAKRAFKNAVKSGAPEEDVLALKEMYARELTNKVDNKVLANVTPNTKNLSNKEYEKLLAQGRITPKTNTKGSQYILSGTERETAMKYKNLITDKDPVRNLEKIYTEISTQDENVGKFLRDNNFIFNSGELKNSLKTKLDDIVDITVDEKTLGKSKQRIVDNFIKSLDKNDAETLWKARKAFDQQIEKAFTGSPTIQNQIKKEFRNAIQDFIAERTPDGVYKNSMKEMSNLFKLRDLVNIKAVNEKGQSAIKLWMKNNPIKTKIIGIGAPSLVGGALLLD